MSSRAKVGFAATLACLLAALGLLAAGAGAKGNRATPERPQQGAKFLEGKPATRVKFGWSVPDGQVSRHIEISRSPKLGEDGGFAKPVRAKDLTGKSREIKLGVRVPGRYYWHVAASGEDGHKKYGPVASFIVLATLSRSEAVAYTEATIDDRLTGHYNLRHIDCDQATKLKARCKFSGNAQGFTFYGHGSTFLKRRAPDNYRFYHYDYHASFLNEECVADHKGKTRKCTDTVHWTA